MFGFNKNKVAQKILAGLGWFQLGGIAARVCGSTCRWLHNGLGFLYCLKKTVNDGLSR